MSEAIRFNISVNYSAVGAGLAAGLPSGTLRVVCVFLAVHGGLWAIYRAWVLAQTESGGRPQ